jgi:hypothetical protein
VPQIVVVVEVLIAQRMSEMKMRPERASQVQVTGLGTTQTVLGRDDFGTAITLMQRLRPSGRERAAIVI